MAYLEEMAPGQLNRTVTDSGEHALTIVNHVLGVFSLIKYTNLTFP